MNIVIYTSNYCPYCVKAKRLFDQLDVAYEEINIEKDPAQRDVMLGRANGQRTVPQIFIGDRHIGGCDDLYALHQSGELTNILTGE